jgi:polar amino acid transport system permease protein
MKEGYIRMDWAFIQRFAPYYALAAQVTIFISFWGIVLSLVIGLACSVITELKIPVARQIVAVYVELSRGTPLLVQLFFLYFGFPKLGITMSAETCAVVGLAFLGGSYMSEALRGGLESVGNSQTESCQVLGMSRMQALRHVIVPQAFSTALPGLVANVIFLVKESSVVSGIALADLMYLTKDLIGLYYDTTESLFMLVVAYALILLPISIVGTFLERRFDYARR